MLVYLFDVLPRLSETTASTLLVRFPCFINEDISFHPFPKSNYMELGEIKKLINHENTGHEGDEDDTHNAM